MHLVTSGHARQKMLDSQFKVEASRYLRTSSTSVHVALTFPAAADRHTGISAGTGRGTGRPRGRPRKQRQEELSGPEGLSSSRRRGGGGGGGSAIFGADIDEILNDPLAAQIGLVPGKRRKKKKRKSKGGEGGGINRRQVRLSAWLGFQCCQYEVGLKRSCNRGHCLRQRDRPLPALQL